MSRIDKVILNEKFYIHHIIQESSLKGSVMIMNVD